ncbi:MAG: hypothetical protein ABSG79_14205 [Bryobacteraceae bacterium]
MERKGGATLAEVMQATSWQAHTKPLPSSAVVPREK